MGALVGNNVVVMPMWKRTTITAIQLSMTLITAGVIIGYGQLNPVLISDGAYHSKCPGNTPINETCNAQTNALNQLFTVGASISIFIQAPSGVILDFLGPRATCWAGLVLFIPGCFVFAFAESIKSIDAYMVGFQLLAAGGPFVFLSSLPVSQLWPDYKAMILLLTNGVYGGGAFVFFLFSSLYYSYHVSLKTMFIGYGILGIAMFVIALFVWPRRSFAESANKNSSSIQETTPERLTVVEILTKSAKDMRSIYFVFIALLVPFLIVKTNFFLSSYTNQIALYLSQSQQNTYGKIVGVSLPAIGMLAGPIGLVFDKFGVNVALILLIVLSSISSVCGLLVNTSQTVFFILQIIRIIDFSIYFPMVFGVWAFALMTKYGSQNFGVLYAAIAILAGIVNWSSQSPLFNFAQKRNSYVVVNIILLSIGAVFIVYPIAIVLRNKFRGNKHGSGYYPIQ